MRGQDTSVRKAVGIRYTEMRQCIKTFECVQGGDLGTKKAMVEANSPARDQHGETIHEEGPEFP